MESFGMQDLSESPRKRRKLGSLEAVGASLTSNEPRRQQQLSRENYTIGWICPLYIELSAALAMLDDVHDTPGLDANDTNTYTVGKIHQHNVVIACLPNQSYGTNNAAVVASNMRRSFPSLRLLLVVGIGGGVPGQVDVRLGDIVVGQTVLQHDLGKLKDGVLEVVGAPVEAPPVAMMAIATLRGTRPLWSSQIPCILSGVREKYPQMVEYVDKSHLQDWLYESSYKHVGSNDTCDQCDSLRRRVRPQRNSSDPIIHYGAIASGNQVLKDALERDRLGQAYNILCVEMEGAGLIRNFPSLVIRGICDYADSHKNKEWQPYAAASAAAYTKEFLSVLPARNCQSQTRNQTRPDLIEATNSRTNEPAEDSLSHHHYSPLSEEKIQVLVESLKFEQIDNRHANIKRAHARTCKWLLQREEYHDWLDTTKFADHRGVLWIKGKPGAGKSTLMKFALAEAKKKFKDKVIISFFFNARGSDFEKSTKGMYRSLLVQLLGKLPSVRHIFESLEVVLSNDARPDWNLESLKQLFEQAIESLGQTPLLCLIDALDECGEDQIRDMVSFFETLGELSLNAGTHFHVCFASRHYPHITIGAGINLILEGQEGHQQDIGNYINSELKIGKSQAANQLRSDVLEKASGVFMWVVLVVKILNEEHDSGLSPAKLRRRLLDIPGDLHALFRDLLMRDNKRKDEMLLCIQWVLFAKYPLGPDELYHAIHSGLYLDSDNPEALENWYLDEITPDLVERFLLSVSKGLAEIIKSGNPLVQFIHESVRDFLLKEGGLGILWPDLGESFEGQSHEKLKECCISYSNIGHGHLPIPQSLSDLSPDKATELRDLANRKLPFLGYATVSQIYHADIAQGFDIYQSEYISRFPREKWVELQNVFEKHQVRRYTSNASFLYILAEHGASNLIAIHPSRSSFLEVEHERYGTPFFAALATGSHAAAEEFFSRRTGRNKAQDALKRGDGVSTSLKEKYDVPGLGRKFKFSKKRGVLSYLAEHGNDYLLSSVLEMTDTSTDINLPCLNHTRLIEWTARNGFKASMKLLIKKGATIDKCADEFSGLTPLALAARNGHDGVLRVLLEQGASIEMTDRHTGRAALSWAVEGGPKVVQLLLDRGAHVDSSDREGCTPLYHAVSNTKVLSCVVSLLLEKGAKTEAFKDHPTLLNVAGAAGNPVAMQRLLEWGVSVETADKSGRTPLSWAAESKNEKAVQLLLDRGARVEAIDNNGYTPLVHAIKTRHRETILLLLANSTNIESSCVNGRTPLSWAVAAVVASTKADLNYAQEVVGLLLDRGANIEAADNTCRTPLHWAVAAAAAAAEARALGKEYCPGAMNLLLDRGANTEAADNTGRTPLHWAVAAAEVAEPLGKEHCPRAINLLLDWGANTEAADNTGRTPLSWAATAAAAARPLDNDYRSRAMNLLLDRGANIEAADNAGRTPLHWVIAIGSYFVQKAVKLLLDRGANIEAADNAGHTPLHWAVAAAAAAKAEGLSYYQEVTTLLLDRGANIEAADNAGRTPLSWAVAAAAETATGTARLRYCQEVTTILLYWGANIEAADNTGRTPLSWALEAAAAAKDSHCAQEVVRLLLNKGVNIGALNDLD